MLLGGGSSSCLGGNVKCNEQADRDCGFVAYTSSIQKYWSGALRDYRRDTFNAAAS